MERRQVVKGAFALGGIAAATKLFPSIANAEIPTKSGGGIPYVGYQETCQKIGMQGNWPHCYYSQYEQLNLQLGNAAMSARIAFSQAVLNKTVTPAAISNLQSASAAWYNHLYNTKIAEGWRLQVGSKS